MVLKVSYKDGRKYWVEVDEVYMQEETDYIEIKTTGEQRRTLIKLEYPVTDVILENEVIWRAHE